MCNSVIAGGAKDRLLQTSVQASKTQSWFFVGSLPHCSYQLDGPHSSGLINYYRIIFYEKNTAGRLASGLFRGFFFVRDRSDMEKTGCELS